VTGEGTELNLAVAALAGLLSFLSPCVLPLLPSYVSFIAGISLDELQAGGSASRTRRTVLVHSLLFGLGFSLVFVALGAGATLAGQLLFRYQALIRKIGGAVVIVLGLSIGGWLRLPFLMREWRMHLADRPAGQAGALVAGVTFAAGWTPCIGPILGAILTMASVSQSAGSGLLLLCAYSAGLAVPFLACSLAIRHFVIVFDRFKRFLPLVTTGSGLVLIALGLLLMTDYFTLLSQLALSLTPEWFFALENALLDHR